MYSREKRADQPRDFLEAGFCKPEMLVASLTW
jgi:hypothetical protein